jgi:hypothetical protein
MLYRSRGIPYSPNAVLAISLKESALCRACAGLTDGCFQIENGGGAASAYGALRQYYPDRFTSDPAQVVGGCHYESSALASAYYSIKTLALLHMHTADPIGFFTRHPDKTTYQKMLNGAYNRGEWWDGMKNAFDNCKTSDVLGCFARASNGAIAVDHAAAIVDYTRALDAAAPFDAPVGEADLDRYWDSIAPLYPPPVDAAAARAALHRAFDARRGGGRHPLLPPAPARAAGADRRATAVAECRSDHSPRLRAAAALGPSALPLSDRGSTPGGVDSSLSGRWRIMGPVAGDDDLTEAHRGTRHLLLRRTRAQGDAVVWKTVVPGHPVGRRARRRAAARARSALSRRRPGRGAAAGDEPVRRPAGADARPTRDR